MEIIIFPIIFGGQTPPVAFSYFNKNYVQPEIFPRELGRKIVKAEEIRHTSDYDTFYIASKMITAEQIETAEKILELAEKYYLQNQRAHLKMKIPINQSSNNSQSKPSRLLSSFL